MESAQHIFETVIPLPPSRCGVMRDPEARLCRPQRSTGPKKHERIRVRSTDEGILRDGTAVVASSRRCNSQPRQGCHNAEVGSAHVTTSWTRQHAPTLVRRPDGRYEVRCPECQTRGSVPPVGIGLPVNDRHEAERIVLNHSGRRP